MGRSTVNLPGLTALVAANVGIASNRKGMKLDANRIAQKLIIAGQPLLAGRPIYETNPTEGLGHVKIRLFR